MNSLPISDTAVSTIMPAVPHHCRKILAIAYVPGAVLTNIYSNQPMLPLIAHDLGVPEGTIGLIPGFTLAGFALGLLMLVPLGDRFDRRRLVLVQTGCACVFALLSAVAPGLPLLLVASLGLGMVSTVPQQLVPFAAVMSPPQERGRSVGTVVSGIMIGILLGRTVGGGMSALFGWRACLHHGGGVHAGRGRRNVVSAGGWDGRQPTCPTDACWPRSGRRAVSFAWS